MSARCYRPLLVLTLLLLVGCGSSDATRPVPVSTSPRVASGPAIAFAGDLDEARRLASLDGRPLMVVFTARWCDYSRALADEALVDPLVVSLADQFVCVRLLDEDCPELASQFQVRSFPTIQFLSPGGIPLHRLTGLQSPRDLATAMQAALYATARNIDRPPTPRVETR